MTEENLTVWVTFEVLEEQVSFFSFIKVYIMLNMSFVHKINFFLFQILLNFM